MLRRAVSQNLTVVSEVLTAFISISRTMSKQSGRWRVKIQEAGQGLVLAGLMNEGLGEIQVRTEPRES
jgi:hypothetical protein